MRCDTSEAFKGREREGSNKQLNSIMYFNQTWRDMLENGLQNKFCTHSRKRSSQSTLSELVERGAISCRDDTVHHWHNIIMVKIGYENKNLV